MNSKTTRHSHLSLWYTTAAVAAVGGGLAYPANEASATVIKYTSGLAAGPSTSIADLNGGVWFDFRTGISRTSYFSDAQFRLQWNTLSTGYTNLFQYTGKDTLGKIRGLFGRFYPLKMAPGDIVGPTPPTGASWGGAGFNNSAYSASTAAMNLAGSNLANWTAGSTGYLGLRFAAPGGNPGDFDYGWAKISIAANYDPTLISFAYNPIPNADPPTEEMPEPNPLLLLATGVAGLGAYRAWRARRDQRQGSSVPKPGASESVMA